MGRGLSIEVALILLSQCDLVHCNEYAVKEYIETGKVDINQLMSILQNEGVGISPRSLGQS
ncbi:hypothetical protein [Vulcanisaeta sp. JCM 16161]|uniref:hypothetical protein n=1 Tax=Vulcanisaeta sp. JCM 16161 TaxID=1295372 RepID=UPI000B340E39|nr:hypothetical protein [Vulcanisaeta sp. JCM 16161]